MRSKGVAEQRKAWAEIGYAMEKHGRAKAKFGQARRSKVNEQQNDALEETSFAVKWRRGVKNCHGR